MFRNDLSEENFDEVKNDLNEFKVAIPEKDWQEQIKKNQEKDLLRAMLEERARAVKNVGGLFNPKQANVSSSTVEATFTTNKPK